MLDILVFSPHPDDAELGCGGAIAKATKEGLSVGLIDLTAGEMGSRGDKETRLKEAEKAKDILGLEFRENMHFPDSFLEVNKDTILPVAAKIREYRPRIILVPYWMDRHPDHVATSNIVQRAWHYAKLRKIDLGYPAYQVPIVVFYELNYQFDKPSFILDVSDVFDIKIRALMAFESQFKRFSENLSELPLIKRWQYYGYLISAKYGEAFLLRGVPKIKSWSSFLENMI